MHDRVREGDIAAAARAEERARPTPPRREHGEREGEALVGELLWAERERERRVRRGVVVEVVRWVAED